MPCTDCYKNCTGALTNDKCVKYTGDDVSALDICTYDPLYNVLNQITSKLVAMLDGSGILLSDLELPCDYLTELQDGDSQTFSNLLSLGFTADCDLNSRLSVVESEVGTGVTVNASCLDLPASPTKNDILKATAEKLCSINTIVNAIEEDYVKASELDDLIAQYNTGNAGSTSQQNLKMVPYVAYEYYGSLSNFDNSGKGLSSAGFDKVYLCNGSNGTPDKRGRVAVGAIVNVPGPSLDSDVDPTLPANAGTGYALKQKFGKSFVTLTITEMPAHSHGVNDPGHSHSLNGTFVDVGDDNNWRLLVEGGSSSSGTAYTGITLSSNGSGQAHENRQPSIAAYYIMYIP